MIGVRSALLVSICGRDRSCTILELGSLAELLERLDVGWCGLWKMLTLSRLLIHRK